MEENNKEFVKKYISAYESLSINNLDTLKNTFTNDIEFEDPFNKVNGKEEVIKIFSEMFEKIDLDGNGTIDYTEFVMATINEKNLVTNERLLQAFKMFDKDGSGAISHSEIKTALGIGDQDDEILRKLLCEIDENNDGEIQFDEFCNMMQRCTI